MFELSSKWRKPSAGLIWSDLVCSSGADASREGVRVASRECLIVHEREYAMRLLSHRNYV